MNANMKTLNQVVNTPSTSDPGRGTEGCRIWATDVASFSTQGIGGLQHDFHRHSLMQLDSLRGLALRLIDSGHCRFIRPGVTQTSVFSLETKSIDGRGVDAVFDDIEAPGSWVALYNIENDPLYRHFLWDALGTVRELMKDEGEVFDAQGFIFISAPPAVTPFHIDRENNFWMQIRGRKSMSVWDRNDAEVVPRKSVEEFICCRSLENVRLREEHRDRAVTFDVGPGDGVYFPSTSPHMTSCDRAWTSPGDGVSISIGVNFYTDVTRRAANVHAFNRELRRVGWTPTPPGKSAMLDRIKYPLGRMTVALRKILLGQNPPNGFL